MDFHRQFTIFILTYLLLTACLCSQPTRSRRQKRGLVKMMMHIMWDPVRLIRYWYAYDVTKEIAKSWRKIIPTILLYPITQQMPNSHGLAKYVHPTNGFRDSNKKLKAKRPVHPVGSHYQESAGNIKPVAIPPTVLHQALPSRYAYGFPQGSIQYYSSRETQHIPKYKQQKLPHVIVGEVPYEDHKDDGNQYTIAHYFVDGTSREEAPTSEVFLPEQVHFNIDDSPSSSSHHVASSEKRKVVHNFDFNSMPPQNYLSYKPRGSVQKEKFQKHPPVLHPGQEIRIVLHPIPVLDSNSLQPPSDGQAMHFVPVQTRSNETSGMSFSVPSVFLKSGANHAGNSYVEHANEIISSDDKNGGLKSSDANITSSESASAEDSESSVTWVKQNSESVDKKEKDMQPHETVRRTVSVHRNSPQKYKESSNGFAIKRHNINMERLREDLKHGTPVLIPFNKNVNFSDSISGPVAKKNTGKEPHDKHVTHGFTFHEENHKEDAFEVPIISESGTDSDEEKSGERNCTQKLLLFLKKTKHP